MSRPRAGREEIMGKSPEDRAREIVTAYMGQTFSANGDVPRYLEAVIASALRAEFLTGAEAMREKAAEDTKKRADTLFAWMSKLPLHSDDRKEKSLRAGELYDTVERIRAIPVESLVPPAEGGKGG